MAQSNYFDELHDFTIPKDLDHYFNRFFDFPAYFGVNDIQDQDTSLSEPLQMELFSQDTFSSEVQGSVPLPAEPFLLTPISPISLPAEQGLLVDHSNNLEILVEPPAKRRKQAVIESMPGMICFAQEDGREIPPTRTRSKFSKKRKAEMRAIRAANGACLRCRLLKRPVCRCRHYEQRAWR